MGVSSAAEPGVISEAKPADRPEASAWEAARLSHLTREELENSQADRLAHSQKFSLRLRDRAETDPWAMRGSTTDYFVPAARRRNPEDSEDSDSDAGVAPPALVPLASCPPRISSERAP